MRIPKSFFLFLIGLTALGLPAGGPAWAQGETFTVTGVEVDATADSATSARAAALDQGHRKAFQELVQRLVPAADQPRVAGPTTTVLRDMVQDFSVENERTSSVRYLADLTFRFQPAAVRSYLQRQGVAFAETRSKPILVLPIFGAAGQAVLWQEPNPWRATWATREPSDGLVPLSVPLGDLSDVSAVDAEQALDGERGPLSALARRYGAEDVLINQLVLAGDPLAEQATLQVIASRLGGQDQGQSFVFRMRQQPGETLDELLARAADQVSAQVNEDWKAANLLRYGEQSSLTVIVPVGSLNDWLSVRRRLENVPSVLDSRLMAMTRNNIEVEITYAGDEQQLARALAQDDLRLTPNDAAGWWELRLSALTLPTGAQPSGGLRPVQPIQPDQPQLQPVQPIQPDQPQPDVQPVQPILPDQPASE